LHEEPDGTVIAVASDEVCEYADRGEAEIEAMIASGELSDDEPCHLGEGGGRCQISMPSLEKALSYYSWLILSAP
jgi:hypothetical protein